jgi:trk system potassium uptake protein TrkA
LVGKTIAEADLRRRHEINVLGVRAADGTTGTKLAIPRPDYVIRKGDTLMLVGTEDAISRFERTD